MTANTPQPTEAQIMLTLAYIANLGSAVEGNDCQTAGTINGMIESYLGSQPFVADEWDLVWGPYIYKIPFIARYRDNTFYVVRSKADASRYVLAIAGTNPNEIFDWVFEDFMVGSMTDWPYGSSPDADGAKISASAAFSLSILHNAHPCPGLPGAGQTLKGFLLADAGGITPNVTVTGHSLGGEMTTTAALWLSDTRGPQPDDPSEEWNPDGKATVNAYAFAGPTAGNSKWADYFNNHIAGTAQRIWNSLDIVPHVWNTHDLSQLPGLYRSGGIEMNDAEEIAVEAIRAALFVSGNDYTQIMPAQRPLEGQIDTTLGDSYLKQAGYQHVYAYPALLGVPWSWQNKTESAPGQSGS